MGFHGLELRGQDLRQGKIQNLLPLEYSNIHLSDWVNWIDCYKANLMEIERTFTTLEVARYYFGGRLNKTTLLNNWSEEILIAKKLNSKNIIFHAIEVDLDGLLGQNFKRTNQEVLEQVVEILQEVIDYTLNTQINICLENGAIHDKGMLTRNDFLFIAERILSISNVYLTFDICHFQTIFRSRIIEAFCEIDLKAKQRIKIIHASEAVSEERDLVPKEIYLEAQNNFFRKREIVKNMVTADSHMPFGVTIKKPKFFLEAICQFAEKPVFITHELKVEPFEVLEMALKLQQWQLMQ